VSILSPGVPRVFLHEIDHWHLGLPEGAAGLRGIEHRALLLAVPGDLVVLGTKPDTEFLGALHSIGFGPRDEDIIVVEGWNPPYATEYEEFSMLTDALKRDAHAMNRLRRALEIHGQPVELSVYMGGYWTAETLAEDLRDEGLEIKLIAGDSLVTDWANLKGSLSDIRKLAGIPQIPGIVVDRKSVLDAMRSVHKDHPGHGVIVRAGRSVGGSGVWSVDRAQADAGHFRSVLDGTRELDEDDRLLVEPLLSIRTSPNVQFDLRPEGIAWIGSTDQILGGSAATGHHGNRAPLTANHPGEVLRQARAVAEVLHNSTMRGVVGIDLIECTPGESLAGETGVYVVEVNARVNTSTFGLVALNRLLGDGWTERFSAAIVPGIPTPGATSYGALREQLAKAGHPNTSGNVPELVPGLPAGVLVTRPPTAYRAAADLVILAAPGEAEAQLTTIEHALSDPG
jgi:hypothetical protein